MNNIEISIYKQNYSINSVLAPGVIFFSLLLITFCFLAVFSLMNQVAIAPIIWLVIATLVFIWFLWEYKYVSIKYFLIDTFSFYAKREFAVIELNNLNPQSFVLDMISLVFRPLDFLNKGGTDLIKSKPENKQNNSRVSYRNNKYFSC